MKTLQKPSDAFIFASWVSLIVGVSSFLAGLWNSSMELNQKGYYFTLILLGLFSAISLQKSVRDKLEDIPVTGIYMGICWFTFFISILLVTVGLWNSTMLLSEKGFYAIAFFLSLYSSIAVQKNIRDMAHFPSEEEPQQSDISSPH
ncbi:MAG: inner membrane protein YiaA [Sulfurovum sp.]